MNIHNQSSYSKLNYKERTERNSSTPTRLSRLLVRPTLDNLCSPSAHSAHDGGWVEGGRDNTSLTLCVDKSHHCESRGSTFRSFLFPSLFLPLPSDLQRGRGGEKVRGGKRMDKSGEGEKGTRERHLDRRGCDHLGPRHGDDQARLGIGQTGKRRASGLVR